MSSRLIWWGGTCAKKKVIIYEEEASLEDKQKNNIVYSSWRLFDKKHYKMFKLYTQAVLKMKIISWSIFLDRQFYSLNGTIIFWYLYF